MEWLNIGGVSVKDLAQTYGTPLYVYDKQTIISQIKSIKSYIKYDNFHLLYACKANTNLSILQIINQQGVDIDAVSPGEVFLALKAGFSPKQIMLTSDNGTDNDFLYAKENGILCNLGSISQIARYGLINPNSNICVRINPDIGDGFHCHTITGGPESKFGVYYDKVDEIKSVAAKYSLKIIGIHSHIGSGILDHTKLILAARAILKVADQFSDLEFIDLGGGVGVPYKPEEKKLDLALLGKEYTNLFNEFADKKGKKIKMILEPGKFIVAECGYLIATALTIKSTPTHTFLGIDSGFNHLVRPIMYGSYHEILIANPHDASKKQKYRVVGNICETGDVFTPEDRELPVAHEGDIIVIKNAGAYGYSMASYYNSRCLPAEVLVDSGKHELIRRRSKYEDLLNLYN